MVKCLRCNKEIRSTSPLRKWCYECRIEMMKEQAKARRIRIRKKEDLNKYFKEKIRAILNS